MLDSDYYVIFVDSDKRPVRWLKEGFRHCYVARNDYGKVWTVIQDGWTHTDVSTHLVEDYPTPELLAGEGATVVPVDYNIGKGFRGHFCFYNCVELVKAVLGIQKPFILTPHQLYRYLT